ncbi:MAG: LemA family protein [Gemmatimonadota bacterium]
MGKALGILSVLAVGVVALFAYRSYNGLVERDEAVSTAWGQVQNVYQRRADLIPNLVETVRGAAEFERETLEGVIEARAKATQVTFADTPNAEEMRQFQAAQGELSTALGRLLVVVEQYPELKATEAFRDLQAQLEGTENRISVERMRFNEVAQTYNTFRRRFPTALFAGAFGFEARSYFEAAPGAEQAPRVDLTRS